MTSIDSPTDRLDCTYVKIRSRELYLLIVVVVDDVEDAADGGDGARSLMSMSSMLKSSSKSSMRGGGVILMTIPRALARRSRRADTPFGRRAVVEALGAVTRRTLPKNLIRLLPVQDRKDKGSGDLLTPVAGARKRSDWSSYSGGAIARRGKNPSSTGYVLAWPAGCLYSPVQPISCRDHDLN
jgi:hypothetical protein